MCASTIMHRVRNSALVSVFVPDSNRASHGVTGRSNPHPRLSLRATCALVFRMKKCCCCCQYFSGRPRFSPLPSMPDFDFWTTLFFSSQKKHVVRIPCPYSPSLFLLAAVESRSPVSGPRSGLVREQMPTASEQLKTGTSARHRRTPLAVGAFFGSMLQSAAVFSFHFCGTITFPATGFCFRGRVCVWQQHTKRMHTR